MPWINQEMCTGCRICEANCPADAISVTNRTAEISDDICIRCGVCHDVCPHEAVRHDGERIPYEVEANLRWVKQLQEHEYYADDLQKQQQLMQRLERHFAKSRKVAEQTLESLSGLRSQEPMSHTK